MALSEQDRQRTVAQWQRDNKSTVSALELELRTALGAIDDWVDAVQANFNQAIPADIRSKLSTSQKIDLLMYVLLRRQGRLKAEED